MTEEELEAEREAQIARGEMPRYGGQHAHLTEEQRQQFEARTPTINSFPSTSKPNVFHLMIW